MKQILLSFILILSTSYTLTSVTFASNVSVPVCPSITPTPVPYISNGFTATYKCIHYHLHCFKSSGDESTIVYSFLIPDYSLGKYIPVSERKLSGLEFYPNQSMAMIYYPNTDSSYYLSDKINKVLQKYAYGDSNYPPDTQENRSIISSILRVFVNGKQIEGQLLTFSSQGTYYQFVFDNAYCMSKIVTVNIELGFKDTQQ